MFYESSSMLYIGETDNLYKRMKKHLKHSDNQGLAQWIWKHGKEGLHLELLMCFRKGISIRQWKALEAQLIGSNSPIFNAALSKPK